MYELGKINYKRYKSVTRTVSVLLMLSTIVWLVISSLSRGGVTFLSSFVDNKISTRQISISYGYFQDFAYQRSDLTESDLININHIDDVVSIYNLYETPSVHQTLNLNQYDIYANTSIYVSYSQFDTFNPGVLQSQDIADPIIAGHKLSADGAIINELVLLYAGIFNYEDVIGSKMTLTINNESIDFTIDGVYSGYVGDDYFDQSIKESIINANGIDNQTMLHPFVLGEDAFGELTEMFGFELTQREVIVESDSIHHVIDIQNEISKMVQNELTSEMDQILTLIERLNQVSRVMKVLLTIVFFQSSLLLISAIFTKHNNQKNLNRLLKTIGYHKKDLMKLYLIDYSFILFKTLVVSTVISFFITYGIDLLLKPLYVENTTLTHHVFNLSFHTYIKFIVVLFIAYYTIIISTILVVINDHKELNHD